MISFTWVLLNPEGVPVSRGLDFGELAADGHLQRITGFIDHHRLYRTISLIT